MELIEIRLKICYGVFSWSDVILLLILPFKSHFATSQVA